MKNTILLTALFLTISNLAFSQTQQNDSDSINKSSIITKSSFDAGMYIKYMDVYLPELTRVFGPMGVMSNFVDFQDGSVRIFFNETNTYYFILTNGGTNDAILKIEYNELIELNKAIVLLSSNIESDISYRPDYLENKYIVNDETSLGYYVKKGLTVNSKNNFIEWFIDVSNTRLFFNTLKKMSLPEVFLFAQSKIEELQKIYDK